MNEVCWFFNENELREDSAYKLKMNRQGDRNDIKAASIRRCERCQQLHKKRSDISAGFYIVEFVLMAVLLFVINVELIYIAITYVVLMIAINELAKWISKKTTGPFKSISDVNEHEEIIKLKEQGYVDKRRF